MSYIVSGLLAAAALLMGICQAIDPSTDPDYQVFALQIQYKQQEAEYKLNITQVKYGNITVSVNVLEDSTINETINKCFAEVKAKYPNAEAICLESVQQEVQQLVEDSVNELEACSNLTYSWNLLGDLLKQANNASTLIDTLVSTMLTEAQNCVNQFYKYPSFKRKCINSVGLKYNTQWDDATSFAQQAYYQISGGGLLVESDILSCQNAENNTFSSKCDFLDDEVKNNCLSLTTPAS